MRTPKHLRDPNRKGPRRGPIGVPLRPRSPQDVATLRVNTGRYNTSLWGWPSRGGVIYLNHATALDFDFLGLDSVNATMRRDRDQDAEDAFCQRLLLLGAKWFDSQQRCGFVWEVAEDEEPALDALNNRDKPMPSTMERTWVSVAYPDGQGPEGGFWVLEGESGIRGTPSILRIVDRSKWPVMMPSDAGRVLLAKTMTEKCTILEKMGAKFYTSLAEYDGAACLKAWTEKTHGEHGPLEWINPVWNAASDSDWMRSGTFEFSADGVKLTETSGAAASSPEESPGS